MNLPDGKWYDWWMVPHFIGWAIIAGWLRWLLAGHLTLAIAVVVVLAGSALWEAVEYLREGFLRYSREPWTNRLIVDPVTNTLGGIAGWFAAGLLM
mgnify:CR=1 FL=1